jgi:NAD(P)H dehydrogenase (quinone)
MGKVLVVYYSRTGNTEKMAKAVEEGVRAEEIEVEVKKVEDTRPEEFLRADGIIIGSPTYYGSMAGSIKELLDESVSFHGQLKGKVGGAFSSAANIGGGNETTILDILRALLIHGMIIEGTPQGDHYGPVAIGEPDQRSKSQCRDLGTRVARLVKRLK